MSNYLPKHKWIGSSRYLLMFLKVTSFREDNPKVPKTLSFMMPDDSVDPEAIYVAAYISPDQYLRISPNE